MANFNIHSSFFRTDLLKTYLNMLKVEPNKINNKYLLRQFDSNIFIFIFPAFYLILESFNCNIFDKSTILQK